MLNRGKTDWTMLQVDFKNAFNALLRKLILKAVRKRCPEALTWMETCYGQHWWFFVGADAILSQRNPAG